MTEPDTQAGVFRPSRFCWNTLDRQDADRLIVELVDWVHWFRHRYEVLELIPPCWYRHPRLFEELLALMTAHKAAYRQENAETKPPTSYWSDMAAWHAYYMRPLLNAVSDMGVSACGPDGCKGLFSAPEDRDPGLDEWIAADLAARPNRAPLAVPPSDEPPTDDEFDPGPEAGARMHPEAMSAALHAGRARPDADGTSFIVDGWTWVLDPDNSVFVADHPTDWDQE